MSIIENALGKVRRESSVAPAAVDRNTFNTGAGLLDRLAAREPVVLSPTRLEELGIMPPKTEERRFMAQYRAIKRALLAPLSQRSGEGSPQRGNVIMVASALPGEGKTFTSFNLARILATERDWVTVLFDADVARQHLTTSLGLRGQAGLLDVLADPNRSIIDVTNPTSTPGLYFVPAGSSADNATELMASARMEAVVRDFLRVYPNTILLFDSSPLLVTPESRALADAVGQIVLVVRAESTLRSDVVAALRTLGQGHQVGVVLNQFQGEAEQYDYYYAPDGSRSEPGQPKI